MLVIPFSRPYSTKEARNEWKQRVKARLAQNERRFRARLRRKALNKLGGKCVRCGISDWRVLQIDHINGGGIKDFKTRHRDDELREIVDAPLDVISQKYQLLCANCNWIKKYEKNENPHQTSFDIAFADIDIVWQTSCGKLYHNKGWANRHMKFHGCSLKELTKSN